MLPTYLRGAKRKSIPYFLREKGQFAEGGKGAAWLYAEQAYCCFFGQPNRERALDTRGKSIFDKLRCFSLREGLSGSFFARNGGNSIWYLVY